MKEYLQQAIRTESKPNKELLERLSNHARAVHAAMGLMTEVGELVDSYKRHIFYNAALDITNAAEECGDVLWYLAILFDTLGIDFEKCMEANIAKLRARYPEKFTEEKAVSRDIQKERQALDGELVMHDVESSSVSAVGWQCGSLVVQFKGGSLYRYKDVPMSEFNALMDAESKGKFLNANIKPRYECESIK